MTAPRADALVVGAGIAGLYALHRLRGAGLTVRGFEAGGDIGGTWYWNRYPGCRCDVESIDYSYSFDPALQDEWRWSERYATQPEILAYLEYVADRFALRPAIRFHTRIAAAGYDERRAEWTVTTQAGERHRGRYLVLAAGALSVPLAPALPGLESFAGELCFTARWPRDGVGLSGRRVAIIGTGSSGIQAAPVIADEAAAVTVFQRTANFSVPASNRPLTDPEYETIRARYPERRRRSRRSGGGSPFESHPRRAVEVSAPERDAVLHEAWHRGGVLYGKAFPDQNSDLTANGYARAFAVARLREIVEDPVTAEDLTPADHPIGTKRICTDSGYFAMYNRPHVELVNLRRDPIVAVTPTGIRTRTGDHDCDVIVFATGFDALTGALTQIDITGRDGRSVSELWEHGPLTYLGLAVPGLPNLFVVNGPGSPSVLANMFLTSEQQVDWVADLIAEARRVRASEIDVRADAAEKWTEHVAEVASHTLFVRADSWYMGANVDGKTRVFMPYIGGFGRYGEICDAIRDGGYEGFVLSSGMTRE